MIMSLGSKVYQKNKSQWYLNLGMGQNSNAKGSSSNAIESQGSLCRLPGSISVTAIIYLRWELILVQFSVLETRKIHLM